MNRTQNMSRIQRDHRAENSSRFSVSLPICEDPVTLVRASLAGDREAFAHIVQQHQGIVCGFACGVLGDPWGSEDIAQETFCIAWKQLETLQNPNQLSSWLCGIARNLTRHALRKRRIANAKNVSLRHDLSPSLPPSPIETSRKTSESTTSESAMSEWSVSELPASESVSQLASGVEEPFTTLWREERNRLLWDTVATIPSIYRIPLVMYYRGERSTAEIATALEISTDAVAQRISRARKLLRTELLRQVEDVLESSGPDEYFTLSVIAILPTVETCRVATSLAGTMTIGSVGITSSTTGSTMKGSWMMYCFSTFSFLFAIGCWVLGALPGTALAIRNAPTLVLRRHLLLTSLRRFTLLGILLSGFVCCVFLDSIIYSDTIPQAPQPFGLAFFWHLFLLLWIVCRIALHVSFYGTRHRLLRDAVRSAECSAFASTRKSSPRDENSSQEAPSQENTHENPHATHANAHTTREFITQPRLVVAYRHSLSILTVGYALSAVAIVCRMI